LEVADFNRGAGTLAISKSKPGKVRHDDLTEAGRERFTGLSAGRAGDEMMLRKADSEPWSFEGARLRFALSRKFSKKQFREFGKSFEVVQRDTFPLDCVAWAAARTGFAPPHQFDEGMRCRSRLSRTRIGRCGLSMAGLNIL
jgi:hypothetical protein